MNHECCLAGGGCGCGYSCGGYYHDEQGKMSPCYYSIIPSSPSISTSAVSHPVAITCFRAPFTARAKLYLFLLRPVSFVVTQCMTFCNCCCSEARAIYHSPVIPQTAVMFLNCGINFRSVPPLTSACCSCAFAVR